MIDKTLLPYIYSVDDKIGIKDLKSSKFDPDDYDFDKIKKWISDNAIWCAVDWLSSYHYKFATIKSKPYIYYWIWNLSLLDKKVVGIVWPRKPTVYGKKVVSELIAKLSWYDVVTISGLADGIDMLAHTESIKQGIPTVAVLGGWLHHFLQTKPKILQEIVDHGGLVLSEFKLLFKPSAFTFPQRNRIIAGLSDLLFLPEWSLSSGSLITVDFALSWHKQVFATPNQIRSTSSQWVNKLISEWSVQVVRDIDDFVEQYFDKYKKVENKQMDSWFQTICDPQHRKILEVIASDGSSDIDNIISKTSIEYADVMVWLTMLEITGNIIQNTPWVYEIWR